MASFEKLPTELLLMIADRVDPPETQPSVLISTASPANLASLSMVNRRLRGLFTNTLYDRYGHLALALACQKPSLDILKAVVREARDEQQKCARINDRVPLRYILQNRKLVRINDVDRADWPVFHQADTGPRWDVVATPLHLACAGGHDDIVEFLLENGADMKAESLNYCECLLANDYPWNYDEEEGGIRVNIPRWLPLHHAFCSGHTSTILVMLKRGAPLIMSGDSPEHGYEATKVNVLHMAAAHGQVLVAQHLLDLWKQGIIDLCRLNPTSHFSRDWGDWDNYSPIHYLVLCADYSSVVAIAKLYQDNGIDIDFQFNYVALKPLVLACRLGSFTAARALLEAGADPHATDRFGTACMAFAMMATYEAWASRRQSKTAWELERLRLIRELARANAFSAYPLSDAAQLGCVNEIKFLLGLGTYYVDQVDDDFMTPLAYAAQNGHVEIAQALLAAGASVSHFQGSDTAAAHCANREPITGGHAEVLRILLEHGATIGFCHNSERPNMKTWEYSGSVLDDAMWRVEHAIQLGGVTAIESSTFNFILKHSTPVNFPQICWEEAMSAVFEAVHLELSRRDGQLVKVLAEYGNRHGFVLNDSTLCTMLENLIARDNLHDFDLFFSLGDSVGVLGTAGYVTRSAALVLAMANYSLGELALGKPIGVIRHLLEERPIPKGRIRMLGDATLLHLACYMGEPTIVQMILDSGHYDLQELWWSATPLMLAIKVDELASRLEIIRLLLSRGADPFLAPVDIIDTDDVRPACTDEVPDILHLGNLPLSRNIRECLNRLAECQKVGIFRELLPPNDDLVADETHPDRIALPASVSDFSPFELAIVQGELKTIAEILKHQPLRERVPKRKHRRSPQSYLNLAIKSGSFKCLRFLLLAGANPNVDPVYPLLSYHLKRFFRSCEQKLCHPVPKGDSGSPIINLEWLGREIAMLGWLLEAGADPSARSTRLPRSFIDQLEHLNQVAIFPEFSIYAALVKTLLLDAFTVETASEPGPDVEKTVRFNLQDTEEWPKEGALDSEEWSLWPKSWREWNVRCIKLITEAKGGE